MDDTGQKLLSRRVPNDPGALLGQLEPFGPRLKVVVEATFNWYWLVDLLEDHGLEVTLAHPLYLKAIAYAKVKTDKVDAHTLAQLLRLGYIPEAWICPRELRATRDLVRRRNRLVNVRAGLLRDVQIQLMKANVRLGRNEVKAIDGRHLRRLLDHPHARRVGLAYLHTIEALTREIRDLDAEIRRSLRRSKPILLLESLPGIGRTLAATIHMETGPIDRFASAKNYCSYCRVAPTISPSGSVTRRGRNSKQGNRHLEWAFSQAANLAIQHYPPIKALHQRLLCKKKKRILAKAIVTHKLAHAAYHVLHKEQPFEMEMMTS